MNDNSKPFSVGSDFFGHLEELRKRLIYIFIVLAIMTTLSFIFVDIIFNEIILAPIHENFITFELICRLGNALGIESLCGIQPNFILINIEMAGQFMAHIKTAFISGFVLTVPWLLVQMWVFLKPGLMINERRIVRRFVFFGSLLFCVGISFSFFVITPLAVMFLGNYQVSPEIRNQIHMGSYISMMTSAVLLTGLLFELPLVIGVFSKLGWVTPQFLRKYRKHSIVASFILAAIITPTTDVVTLLLVALPLLLLYESGIMISRRIHCKK